MKTRSEFAKELGKLDLTSADRGVALLWYYRQTQEYEERSASDLASDLRDEGFPKPNVTRLALDLRRSKKAVRGKREGTFQLDVRALPELDHRYVPLLDVKVVKVTGAILPPGLVAGTRSYLERISHQINAGYELGLYDAAAVLCRRLMESLIVEVYISKGRQNEIQQNGVFVMLERLIAHIRNDQTITLTRGTAKTMDDVKQLGDTAAHDRTYVTQQIDLDDVKGRYRKLIAELLTLSGIRT